MKTRLVGSRASSSLSRRISSGRSSRTVVRLQLRAESRHAFERVARALGGGRAWKLAEELLPARHRLRQVAAHRRSVAELELYLGVMRIGLGGASQLIPRIGWLTEFVECSSRDEPRIRRAGIGRERAPRGV